jgi:hypothetical protein
LLSLYFAELNVVLLQISQFLDVFSYFRCLLSTRKFDMQTDKAIVKHYNQYRSSCVNILDIYIYIYTYIYIYRPNCDRLCGVSHSHIV